MGGENSFYDALAGMFQSFDVVAALDRLVASVFDTYKRKALRGRFGGEELRFSARRRPGGGGKEGETESWPAVPWCTGQEAIRSEEHQIAFADCHFGANFMPDALKRHIRGRTPEDVRAAPPPVAFRERKQPLIRALQVVREMVEMWTLHHLLAAGEPLTSSRVPNFLVAMPVPELKAPLISLFSEWRAMHWSKEGDAAARREPLFPKLGEAPQVAVFESGAADEDDGRGTEPFLDRFCQVDLPGSIDARARGQGGGGLQGGNGEGGVVSIHVFVHEACAEASKFDTEIVRPLFAGKYS